MANYRIYLLKPNGRFAGVVEAFFGSDEEAAQHALTVLTKFKEAEIWAGARFVARVTCADMIEPRLNGGRNFYYGHREALFETAFPCTPAEPVASPPRSPAR